MMKAKPLKDKEIVGSDGHIGLFDKEDVRLAWQRYKNNKKKQSQKPLSICVVPPKGEWE